MKGEMGKEMGKEKVDRGRRKTHWDVLFSCTSWPPLDVSWSSYVYASRCMSMDDLSLVFSSSFSFLHRNRRCPPFLPFNGMIASGLVYLNLRIRKIYFKLGWRSEWVTSPVCLQKKGAEWRRVMTLHGTSSSCSYLVPVELFYDSQPVTHLPSILGLVCDTWAEEQPFVSPSLFFCNLNSRLYLPRKGCRRSPSEGWMVEPLLND